MKMKTIIWVALIVPSLIRAQICSISIKEGSQNEYSRPGRDQIWSVSHPFDYQVGVGTIVNPEVLGGNQWEDFALHQNEGIGNTPPYVAPHIPEPSSVTVSYSFSTPQIVTGVEIVQHVNGITQVEGFLGDGTLNQSIGNVFGPAGDVVTSFVANEAEPQFFDFQNTSVSGTELQIVIRKTVHPFAFACYRIYPLDENGLRIPVGCLPDFDRDGIFDANDNCPTVFNPDQFDLDNNGIGDVCEETVADFYLLGDLEGGEFGSWVFDVGFEHNATEQAGKIVAVGRSLSAFAHPYNEAFRWVEGDGMVGLGDFHNPSSTESVAWGVSGDGSIVVGFGQSTSGPEGFRWPGANQGDLGYRLGDLSGGAFWSIARAVSSDGRVIVGGSKSSGFQTTQAWRMEWGSSGLIPMGDLPGGNQNSEAFGVSPDGSAIVGYGTNGQGKVAFLWKKALNQMQNIGHLPGGRSHSIAWDVSDVTDQGYVVVGESGGASMALEAFRWTEGNGFVALGDFEGGNGESVALGVSDDGKRIVGYGSVSTHPGVDSSKYGAGYSAFLWDEASGMRSIQDILTSQFDVNLDGTYLIRADAISSDGTIVGGTALHEDGTYEGWVVRFRKAVPSCPPSIKESKFGSPNPGTMDRFGASVDVEGDLMAVSATGSEGYVVLYEKDGSQWMQNAVIHDPSNSVDHFGNSIALSGDTLVVGSPLHDHYGLNTGAVYVYQRSNLGWSWEATLYADASGRSSLAEFGRSVDVDGDTIIVGTPRSSQRGSHAGSAYVFVRGQQGWEQEAVIVGSATRDNDEFGHSVAISGDRILIGVVNSDAKGSDSGQAYIFERNGNNWEESAILWGRDNSQVDVFGTSVSLDGNTAAIGSAQLGGGTGVVYVFVNENGDWKQQQILKVSDGVSGDSLSWNLNSLDIDGDRIAVGTFFHDHAGINDSGAVYVFERHGNSWQEIVELVHSDAKDGDWIGAAASISGKTVLAGAYHSMQNGLNEAGAAYLFEFGESGIELYCPDNLIVECDSNEGTIVHFDSPEVVASCPQADISVICEPASGSLFPLGQTVVYCSAVDSTGNVLATCDFMVSVDDSIPPVIVCPPDLTVECDGLGNQAVIDAWLTSVMASDACGVASIMTNFAGLSNNCGATGAAKVTFTATDVNGNSSSCSASISIEDSSPPTIDVVAKDMVVECDGAGNGEALQLWLSSNGGAEGSDACGGITWSNDFIGLSDDCGTMGSATVTFMATDECGLTNSTTATFTIVDTTPPSMDVLAKDMVVECDGRGNQEEFVDWLNSHGGAIASDTCGDVIWTHDDGLLNDNCGQTSSTPVTFVATDECGNSTMTSARFIIIDTTGPGPLMSDVYDISPNQTPITFMVTSEDLCGDVVVEVISISCHKVNQKGKIIDVSDDCDVVFDGDHFTIIDSGGVGTNIIVQARAKDDCGNVTNGELVVHVLRPVNKGGEARMGDPVIEL